MVKFEANGKLGKVIIKLPTSLNEITPEYIGAITDEIVVADNYSLIALCHKEKLSAFVLAGRSNKNEISTSVIPLFVKRGFTEDKSFQPNIEVCDKLLITPTAMSMALHVNAPMNNITMPKFMAAIEGDRFAHQNALALNEYVYFLEFKIIPNCDILGVYKTNLRKDYTSPFGFEVVNNDSVCDNA